MAKKPLICLSFLIAAIASAFILDGHSAPNARAQKTGAEAIAPSVGQKSYPTIATDDWLDPPAFGKLPFNMPVLVDNEGGKQHLALISQDMLSPPPCSRENLESCTLRASNPGREFKLVIQWRQGKLLAWAYERLEVDNTRPKLQEPPRSSSPIGNPTLFSDKATIVKYTPLPEINEGLHWNLSWEAYCGSTSCLYKPLPPVTPVPPVIKTPLPLCPPSDEGELLPDGTVRTIVVPTKKDPSCVEFELPQIEPKAPVSKPLATQPQSASLPSGIYRLIIYVENQEFQLDGKGGVFTINAPLAKALREAKSSAVKIITPRKWEATINPEAVRNLSLIYQESKSSQMPR